MIKIKNDLTYGEAIEQVMLKNGNKATLRQIYSEIWNYKDINKLIGKTKEKTIQERVQRDKRFFRMGIGFYGLSAFKNELINESPAKNKFEAEEREHTQIQGMLIEIGNVKRYQTYTNDKRCKFKGIRLGELTTLEKIPNFTYESIIKNSISFCDVVWINERGFADTIFEVEISTDFRDALIKFSEMQDFYTRFYCVSNDSRTGKFKRELEKTAFKTIKNRVNFLSDTLIKTEYEKAMIYKNSVFSF